MNYIRLLTFLLLATTIATAQDSRTNKKEYTIRGEVVDVACYMSGDARGPDHIECAKACAKAGGALGLLTADGKLYVSLLADDHTNPNHVLMDHIGHVVEAKGYVRVKGGVNGIMIKSVSMPKM